VWACRWIPAVSSAACKTRSFNTGSCNTVLRTGPLKQILNTELSLRDIVYALNNTSPSNYTGSYFRFRKRFNIFRLLEVYVCGTSVAKLYNLLV
jgi:hypothetical protein